MDNKNAQTKQVEDAEENKGEVRQKREESSWRVDNLTDYWNDPRVGYTSESGRFFLYQR